MLFHTLATFSACFWADLCAGGYDGRLNLTTALRERDWSRRSLLFDLPYMDFIFVGFKNQSVILSFYWYSKECRGVA